MMPDRVSIYPPDLSSSLPCRLIINCNCAGGCCVWHRNKPQGLLEPQPPPWSVFPRFPRARSTSDASSSPITPHQGDPLEGNPLYQGNLYTKRTSVPGRATCQSSKPKDPPTCSGGAPTTKLTNNSK